MGWTPTPEQREGRARAYERAKELRDSGASWRVVAETLTAEGHQTKNGGPWYIEGVRRLIASPELPAASPKYGARHYRVRAARGDPEDYECARCGGPALVWATLHGTGGMNPEDYEPMCQPCNLAYDGVTGSPRSAETRAKMSRYASNRTAEHRANLSRSLSGLPRRRRPRPPDAA